MAKNTNMWKFDKETQLLTSSNVDGNYEQCLKLNVNSKEKHISEFMHSISSLATSTISGKTFILRHFFNHLYEQNLFGLKLIIILFVFSINKSFFNIKLSIINTCLNFFGSNFSYNFSRRSKYQRIIRNNSIFCN